MMNFKSVSDLNHDVKRWLSQLPKDIDVVIGIPRSGMLVANLVSLYLDIPMADIDGFLKGHVMGAGARKSFADKKQFKKPLVVDDSVLTGRALIEAKGKLRSANLGCDYYYGAPYVTPDKTGLVDFFHEIIPIPRIFEWNFMHHATLLSEACVDIDGILCRDPLPQENDDGPNYVKFITTVPVKIRPTTPVKWLVTCRLEKYRPPTERWLLENNIRYENLVMLDLPSKEARIKSGVHAKFKADVYKKTGAVLFIESSYDQAVAIAKLSDKYVVCTDRGVMIYPNAFYEAYRDSWNVYQIVKGRIRSIVSSLRGNICR